MQIAVFMFFGFSAIRVTLTERSQIWVVDYVLLLGAIIEWTFRKHYNGSADRYLL